MGAAKVKFGALSACAHGAPRCTVPMGDGCGRVHPQEKCKNYAICPKIEGTFPRLGATWPNGGGHGPLGRITVSAPGPTTSFATGQCQMICSWLIRAGNSHQNAPLMSKFNFFTSCRTPRPRFQGVLPPPVSNELLLVNKGRK